MDSWILWFFLEIPSLYFTYGILNFEFLRRNLFNRTELRHTWNQTYKVCVYEVRRLLTFQLWLLWDKYTDSESFPMWKSSSHLVNYCFCLFFWCVRVFSVLGFGTVTLCYYFEQVKRDTRPLLHFSHDIITFVRT